MSLAILQPQSASQVLRYPDVVSEFEVQAWLYDRLLRAGHDVRGEVQFLGSFGLRASKASCRFDLVIFRDREPSLVLEVKARPVKHGKGVQQTRQGWRYRQFGVPVLFVYGLEGAQQALAYVEAYMT